MIKTWSFVLLLSGVAVCSAAQSVAAPVAPKGDSATVAASLKYQHPSFFQRLFLGKNYRTAWATPVTVPVFHLTQMGFTIKELGGGQQTKSLQLLDRSGHGWALRTIDKDVEKALPPEYRHTLAQRVVQDMVSAAHPYAPLAIPVLAQATGVLVASPKFFFVPNDTALGEYNALFRNTLCLLEDREPTPDNSETENTGDFIETLLKNNKIQIDEIAVLRARLLDMLIGDWDRHQDQWRWGFEKDENGKKAYAIPRDRDQAFFYSKGLLVKLARLVAAKHLVGFAPTTSKLKKLNAKSWNFDRTFMNGLDEAAWRQTTEAFIAALPDTVLQAAVEKLPPEVYPLHGPLLQKKLISRRNSLLKDALRYQRFLASYVTIAGTNEPDRFVITTTKDSITVQQYSGADFVKRVYNRTFHRRDTYKVSIVGLGGADEFVQASGGASRIRLVLDGGTGTNVYKIKKARKLRFFNSAMDAKAYVALLKTDLKIKD